MKQFITVRQQDSLSDKGIIWLRDWCMKRGYDRFQLSIGQMIEFLGGQDLTEIQWSGHVDSHMVCMEFVCKPGKLCDYLWTAVKQILEKERG